MFRENLIAEKNAKKKRKKTVEYISKFWIFNTFLLTEIFTIKSRLDTSHYSMNHLSLNGL